jgi:hypothetical protein
MKKLPFSANLEFLKNEARDKQKFEQTTLSQAQFTLAREYGFSSWTRLKIYVEALSMRGHSPDALCQKMLGLLPNPNALCAAFARMPLSQILALRQTLSSIQLAQVVAALCGALTHTQPRVRFNAAMALDHMGNDTCTSALLGCLSDPVPRVRRAALHALSCDACKIVPLENRDPIWEQIVQLALHDDNARVRLVALQALSGCSSPEGLPILQASLGYEMDFAMRRTVQKAILGLTSLHTESAREPPI